MPDLTAFLTEPRETAPRRPAAERVRDWFEIYLPLPESKLRTQASRCMDCGVPFCHNGCPLTNLIPDFNSADIVSTSLSMIGIAHPPAR